MLHVDISGYSQPMCKTGSPMGVFLRCMKYFCMSTVNACVTQTPWGWSVTHVFTCSQLNNREELQ